MNSHQYKELSVREFTKAAATYETDHAGVYNLCKKDYPDILAELEREPFTDLLDCGCGTAPEHASPESAPAGSSRYPAWHTHPADGPPDR